MMNVHEFFSWAQISSFAGATAVTIVVTRLLCYLELARRLPSAILSYLVALVLLVEAEFFVPPAPTFTEIALCFLNAAGVALAAMGSADLLLKTQSPQNPTQ